MQGAAALTRGLLALGPLLCLAGSPRLWAEDPGASNAGQPPPPAMPVARAAPSPPRAEVKLSEAVTAGFLRGLEKLSGARLAPVEGKINSYDDVREDAAGVGHSVHWFMDPGTDPDSAPAVLSLEVWKTIDEKAAARKFREARERLAGYAITDRGERPLPDEGRPLSLSGFEEARRYDGPLTTILARRGRWFIEAACLSRRLDAAALGRAVTDLGKRIGRGRR